MAPSSTILPSPAPRRSSDRRGFALLITITLLAFLVLLLVSLASLTRVETQVAGNNQQLVQARQNALMALNIALGQLQKYTGPDQRVTAPADIAIPAGVTITAATATTTALTSLDTYWRGSRNRHWTGAWSNTNSTTYDPENPSAYNATPGLLSWLVSGNENTATYTPTSTIVGLTAASTPLDEIKDASGNSYRLLVKSSAAVATATDLDRAVTAPQVPIQSNSVPGTTGTATTIGHYAWWVGDEGIKARANLIDAYSGDTTAAGSVARMQAAQRPAIEGMTINNSATPTGNPANDGLAPYYQPNLASLPLVLTSSQLDFINTSSVYQNQLQQRFHDLTASSRGVLADVKNGGLKRDLSYLFGQSSLANFRTALTAAYNGASVAASSDRNPVLSTATTPYAALSNSVSTFPGNDANPIANMFTYGATWEQLWSFANMGNTTTATPAGAFDSSGNAVPRLQTGTQHGLTPLLVQSKLFYRLRIVGGSPDPDGTNRTGEIWVDTIPVIVLANPYDVPLAAQTYFVAFGRNNNDKMLLYYGSPSDPNTPAIGDFTRFYSGSGDLGNNYTGSLRLKVTAPVMPPGVGMVFTLKNTQNTIPTGANATAATAAQLAAVIEIGADFDPTCALTYDTGLKIPATATYAALVTMHGTITTELYSADYTSALGDQTLIRELNPHTYVAASADNTFIVYPMRDGTQQGGGLVSTIQDASFSDPVTDGDPTTGRSDQFTIFYQANYRTFTVANAAATSFAGKDIARSWATTSPKSGATGGAGSTPNSFIQSNVMFKTGSTSEVRWGLYNTGYGPNGTVPSTNISGDTGLVNILYDIPHPGCPLSSLGQLQHFNISGCLPLADYTKVGFAAQYAICSMAYQNNLPIGNSYPDILLSREKVMDTDYGMGFQHDGSYLWNDLLSDRFYFSTYPATGNFDFAANKLRNPRYRPFRDRTQVPWNDPSQYRGDGSPATAANSRAAAQNLLVDGAFNINSTSIDAWKALFSSLKNVPVGGETSAANLTAPFARTPYQTGANTGATAGNTVNAWSGTFNFTPAQINSLANEMVMQVHKRGPFLSMADFVNRRLITKAADTFSLGLSGALQSAIDRVVNQTSNVTPAALQTKSNSISRVADTAFIMPTGISGGPGYLLQADVLSSLGSSLSARSDTFVIRTYGDASNPVTGQVQGRSWCEAVVQRLPDYVLPSNGTGGNAPADNATDPLNAQFGRRYIILSFRWLSPNDV